ncbi:MAG: MarR family transcriptional regulator [Bacteroidetes bacterium]|jgi:DNA-binding MarR family transcriptional regulator|nr:MarR family transcriptional regulator [Bacteroidota bacterium]
MKLEEEIKSRFDSEYHKMAVNIIYTQYFMQRKVHVILKPFGITKQQYNVLRILRGQSPNKVNISTIIERMLDKMSNASRLVNKLAEKGLVSKSTGSADKRNTEVWITKKGLKMLEEIKPLILDHYKALEGISAEEAKVVNEILDKVRESYIAKDGPMDMTDFDD